MREYIPVELIITAKFQQEYPGTVSTAMGYGVGQWRRAKVRV